MEVGGYHNRPDWPKMGPSPLIATCLIVAVRTAKWAPHADPSLSERDLNNEIEFAIQVANRVLANLMTKYETIFPQKKEPWYQSNEQEVRP